MFVYGNKGFLIVYLLFYVCRVSVVSCELCTVESPGGNGGHVGLGSFVGHDCFSVSVFHCSFCVFCRMIHCHGHAWVVGLCFLLWSACACIMCALLANGMSTSL